ncbi:MAG: PilZ domain-containing protein [Acidithiobacillus ferriphilus]|uniref:PilZ domain-containing protein n=1 Tax=Acidithiobacillus ferrivorans TaxID=160808 RepID=UPI001C06958E|nr:PilZ domain-containing protein [Acidithiobacillus ferrivorans]MBU2852339.1 PilZ domain-containing protein [Acidithiobacillus ferrivorans]
MPKPLSVDERLEAQFSSWDIAPVPEIPDLLMTLRTNGTTITLFKDQVQQTFTAKVAQLEAKSIRLTLQDDSTEGDPFQMGGKVLCVGYGKDYALSFVANAAAAVNNILHISYPVKVYIHKGRMHERFALKVPISALWSKNNHELIFGDVMDISLGGFLGGMNVASFDDGTRTFQRGEIGQVTLTKPDGQKWLGSAELRRSDRITADKRDPEDIIGPINGFSLLGFAFLFKGTEQSLSLEKFLEGTLETL